MLKIKCFLNIGFLQNQKRDSPVFNFVVRHLSDYAVGLHIRIFTDMFGLY